MKHSIIVAAILSSFTSFAQPGWQQRVDSKIDVTLDDKKHLLHAHEELTYTNNSPDTLRFIYMHLWPNAYKNDHTVFARQQDQNGKKKFYYAKPADRGYMDSLQFFIDGQAAEHYSTENTPDIARVDLPKPLLPGKTIKITTPFKVKLPKVFSRLGHTGQSYSISQWFPKPAVYDKLGWHPIPYLDQGEFYSEFGSYDVSITLPANYIVMATGNCTDEKENKWLDDLSQQPFDKKAYKLRLQQRDSALPSATEMKTIHFHEDNVHDFAWFADKRWIVRKDTVSSPGTNEVVTTWAAFLPSYGKAWEKATGYLKETVKHYGKWVGPYRYKTIKAVLGDMSAGGGMEYPTVTVIDRTINRNLDVVVAHEAGHNWFYGMLGSNERDHAWMDEGMNTFYEQKTTADLKTDTAPSKRKKLSVSNEAFLYFERASVHTDQATDQTSANFEKTNYGLDVYYKTAMGLRWLEQYMGESDFQAGMHDYYDTWHFHHPYPEDFKACMQKHSKKSIDWFFDALLTTNKKIDFTITRARANGDSTQVTVRNNSGVKTPVLINAVRDDSTTSSGWSAPFTGTATFAVPGTNWNKLKIDDVIPDAKSANDVYRRRAIFHHFGLKVQPFGGLNLSEKDKLFICPAVGYNQYDGIMGGLLIHNLTLPENRFRFAITPLYSAQSNSIVGAGSIGYVWYPKRFIKEIMLQADGKAFHSEELFSSAYKNGHVYTGYSKVAPSLEFTFKENNFNSTVTRTLKLKAYSINEEYLTDQSSFSFAFAPGTSSSPIFSSMKPVNHTYGQITYRHINSRPYNPFSYTIEGHGNSDFAKINVEGNLRIDYNKPNKSLFIRGYFGKFFAMSNTAAIVSRYELNASYTGRNDYLYDGTYIARNADNKIASQQLSIQEGGFKVPTLNNAARSDNWMASVNLKTDLPIKFLPIRLFLDAGLIPNANPTFKRSGATTLLYDAGVEVYITKVLSLYIPIIMSNDFQNKLTDTYGKKNVFGRSISFTMQLQNVNWLRAPGKAVQYMVN